MVFLDQHSPYNGNSLRHFKSRALAVSAVPSTKIAPKPQQRELRHKITFQHKKHLAAARGPITQK